MGFDQKVLDRVSPPVEFAIHSVKGIWPLAPNRIPELNPGRVIVFESPSSLTSKLCYSLVKNSLDCSFLFGTIAGEVPEGLDGRRMWRCGIGWHWDGQGGRCAEKWLKGKERGGVTA